MLDFLKMINKEDVITQVNKPWKRSFRDGVVIPDNEDLQTKIFNARCNALKCDLPDENHACPVLRPKVLRTGVFKSKTRKTYGMFFCYTPSPTEYHSR